LIVTLGYVVMRFAMVAQWVRAARGDPQHAPTAYRYAIGITLVQIGWVAWLLLPGAWQTEVFAVLALAELAVPVWAERITTTTWHAGHIAERYGLFTIIVLGESILSATTAIQSVVEVGTFNTSLIGVVVGGILIIFCMWWLYFDQPVADLLTSLRVALIWGYGHLLIFASAAAVGAGLAVAVDYATAHAEISALAAGATVAFPVALFLIGVWTLHQRPQATTSGQTFRGPIVALLIALTPFTAQAVLLTGLLLTGLVALRLFDSYHAHIATTARGAN
ncbi:MAG: Integral membrane protein, partial [uncultured Chloroflexia bacterium]